MKWRLRKIFAAKGVEVTKRGLLKTNKKKRRRKKEVKGEMRKLSEKVEKKCRKEGREELVYIPSTLD